MRSKEFRLDGDDIRVAIAILSTLDETKYASTTTKSLILRCRAAIESEGSQKIVIVR